MITSSKSGMGFDLYLNVVASCSLYSFIKHCKDLYLEDEHKNTDANISKFITCMSEQKDFSTENFLDSIEINFDHEKYTITVYDWKDIKFNQEDADADEDETGFHIYNYLDLILFNIIMKALEDVDDNLMMKISSLFDDVEEVSISKSGTEIKYTLFYDSSYKGRGSIDVDFNSVSKQISTLKELFVDVEIKTYVGYD